MSEATTLAVIGAGLAGVATAWRLAEAGHEVAVLERAEPANAQGSSHGSARILRYAYPQRFYTELMVSARSRWDQLERESGRSLVTTVGGVDSGELRRPRALAAHLDAAGVEHELLSESTAAERFGMLRVTGEVLWHPDAGVLDAEQAVHAMLNLARHHGAQVKTGWDLRHVERTAHGFRLTSAAGAVLEAERLVVCAGGWLPALIDVLPLGVAARAGLPALTVRQEQAYHLPYRQDFVGSEPWPTIIHKDRQIEVYSLPGGRDAGFAGQKIAEFAAGKSLPSAREQDGLVDPRNRERVLDFARRHLPGVDPHPYAETTCLFTSTPDENFLVDRADGITLVSPCSGHGAKFAPLIGEIAADVATGVAEPPEPFRLRPEPASVPRGTEHLARSSR